MSVVLPRSVRIGAFVSNIRASIENGGHRRFFRRQWEAGRRGGGPRRRVRLCLLNRIASAGIVSVCAMPSCDVSPEYKAFPTSMREVSSVMDVRIKDPASYDRLSLDELAQEIRAKPRTPLIYRPNEDEFSEFATRDHTTTTRPAKTTASHYSGRWVIKFSDSARVRVESSGKLVSQSNRSLAPINSIQQRFGLKFVPLIRVSITRLQALERRALMHSSITQPDLAGVMVVTSYDSLQSSRFVAAMRELSRLSHDVVEFLYPESYGWSPPSEPVFRSDIPPKTDDLSAFQGYLGADPGINAKAGWERGLSGKGVRISDVEMGWDLDHEEFNDVEISGTPGILTDHGTSVIGITSAPHNGYGIDGIAPDASVSVFSTWSRDAQGRSSGNVSALTDAIEASNAGDVVLVELQRVGGPEETDMATWMVTKAGTDAGVVVVAAAGNGSQNLDDNVEFMSWGDSGSIMVGAGSPDMQHDKLDFSAYGKRLNLQAWGSDIHSAGGEWKVFGNDFHQGYTNDFGGTSGAAPIVAGACLLLQQFAKEELGGVMRPTELRQLLIDTGIPQGSGEHIGPMPDVLAAIDSMVDPDENPPVVEIVDPKDDIESSEVPLALGITVKATDDSGNPIRVDLEINGQVQNTIDDEAPYQFELDLDEGSYTIVAIAEDRFGNKGRSESIQVAVGSIDSASADTANEDSEDSTGSDSETGDTNDTQSSQSDSSSEASDATPSSDDESDTSLDTKGSGDASPTDNAEDSDDLGSVESDFGCACRSVVESGGTMDRQGGGYGSLLFMVTVFWRRCLRRRFRAR